MAKLDKAELKKQGAELKETVAQGRKKTLNFALLSGKDQMYLKTHLKKNPAMLRKEAKKDGGGPKGVHGTFHVEGKTLVFSVEEEGPGNFVKLTKKHFMERGVTVSVEFRLPEGAEEDAGAAEEEQATEDVAKVKEEQVEELKKEMADAGVEAGTAPSEAPETEDPQEAEKDNKDRGALIKRFKKFTGNLRDTLETVAPDVRKDVMSKVKEFGEHVKSGALDKAEEFLNELEEVAKKGGGEAETSDVKEEQINEMNKESEAAGVETSPTPDAPAEENGDAEEADKKRGAFLSRFKKSLDDLRGPLKNASEDVQKEIKEKIKAIGDSVKSGALDKAEEALTTLEEGLESGGDAVLEAAKGKRKSILGKMKEGLQSMLADLK